MLRRGLSLVEVMVSLGMMLVILGAAVALFRPPEVVIGQRRSSAAALFDAAMARIADLPLGQLASVAGAERAAGFCEISLERLGMDAVLEAADATALEPHLFVRIVHHVDGRFGLHRIDGALEYHDGRTKHRLARSEVRRNASELSALAILRARTSPDRLTEDELRHGIARLSHAAPLVLFRRAGDGPWLTPLFPERLRRFYAPKSIQAGSAGEVVGPHSDGVVSSALPRPGETADGAVCE